MIGQDKTSKKSWKVVYTRSRSEKKVRDELMAKNIECFLPLQKRLRQWKDRKKWVEFPLMSGYCFVHVSPNEYDSVLHTPNVVCYVTFEGKAAIIPDSQIDYLKQILLQNEFEVNVSHDNFEPGQRVEIISGPFIGLRGELVNSRGRNKFILRFDQINSTVVIEVASSELSALPEEDQIL